MSLSFVAYAGRDFFSWETLSHFFKTNALGYFWNLVAAFIILAAGHWLSKIILVVVERWLLHLKLEITVRKFLCRVVQGFLFLVVVLAVLNIFGVETTALIATIGAIAMSIGLALQGSLSNFAAGVLLVVLRPFKVDDVVEAGGISGTVEEVGLFSTHVRTSDNRLVIVPNSTFISQPVTNFTAKTMRRVDIIIGVSYDDNLKVAQDIIRGVLVEESRVLQTPAPSVFVDSLGDSSVNIAVRPWVSTGDYWPVKAALLEKIKVALETGGCSIPYPQREVHIRERAVS